MRTIAFGDIHGCSVALKDILAEISPGPEDKLIFLGDYVDRGPDSKGVLEILMGLNAITLLGNHEEMVLWALRGGNSDVRFWKRFGGKETLQSYGVETVKQIPSDHIRFLEKMQLCYETDSHIFVHAYFAPHLPLDMQAREDMLWRSMDTLPGPHFSGKRVIVGHTTQKTGKILDCGYLKCIDTGCGLGGHLTALEVNTGNLWQVPETGGKVEIYV